MAEKKVSPAESISVIQATKEDIKAILGNDAVQKVVIYAPLVLNYAQKYAQSTETEVDDRAVVIAEAIALILKGGIPELLKAWSE